MSLEVEEMTSTLNYSNQKIYEIVHVLPLHEGTQKTHMKKKKKNFIIHFAGERIKKKKKTYITIS